MTGGIKTWLLVLLLLLLGCDRGSSSSGASSAKASPREQKLKTTDWSDKKKVVAELGFLEASAAQSRGSESLRDAFVSAVDIGVVTPVVLQLMSELREATGESYDDEYDELKLYIALHEPARAAADADWIKTALLPRAAQELGLKEEDVKLLVVIGTYVDHLAAGHAKRDKTEAVIKSTRDVLSRQDSGENLYRRIVLALDPEKYPPVTLDTIFADRPDALKIVRSKGFVTKQQKQQVRGPYTKKGFLSVTDRITREQVRIEKETWVLPASGGGDDGRLQKLEALRTAYEKAYIEEWMAFLKDIEVTPSASAKDLDFHLTTLLEPEWPLERLFRTVDDHTRIEQLKAVRSKFEPFTRFGITRREGQADTYLTQYQEVLTSLKAKNAPILKQDPEASLDRPAMNRAEEASVRFVPPDNDPFREVIRAWVILPLTMR